MATSVAVSDAGLAKIQAVLERVMADAGCAAVLLLARGGESLASAGAARAMDLVSVGALAAGGFCSTAPLAQLLGEREFAAVIHEGAGHSLHVSGVDDATILIVVFDERTTAGMVRLFAREAATELASVLGEARAGRSVDGRPDAATGRTR